MANKVLIALTLPILIGLVSACSCIYLENSEVKLENAELVFSGKVVDLEILESYPVQYRAHFEIDKYWKSNNNSPGQLTISSIKNDGANCGYNFEENEEYLIYAYFDEETGEYTTNACMGSLTLETAQTEITNLDNIIDPIIPQDIGTPISSNIFSRFFSWLKNIFS